MVRNNCIICGNKVREYLDLGNQPLANSFHKKMGEYTLEYPLVVAVCENCWHSQLIYQPDVHQMFDDYIYVSGTSSTLGEYFKTLSKDTLRNRVPRDTRVLELACNDGTLLQNYVEAGCKKVVGVDPAKNITHLAEEKGIEVIPEYWGIETSDCVEGRFDIVLAINVLPHVPYPYDFLLACKSVMIPGSRLYVQTSQCDMFLNGEFDAIYHEHHSYFTASSFLALADRVGLIVVDAKKVPIHSQSFLWTLTADAKPGWSKGSLIKPAHCMQAGSMWAEEDEKGWHETESYTRFARNARGTIANLSNLVYSEVNNGHLVVGYGASAKWNTIANYANIHLDYIVDDNPMKQGLRTPGMDDYILSLDELKSIIDMCKSTVTFICTAWNFYEELKYNILKMKFKDVRLVRYFPEITVETI